MNRNNTLYIILAAVLTLLITGGTVLVLLFTSLHYQYPPKDDELEPLMKQDSIMFGGEYVMLGEQLEPTDNTSEAQAEQPEAETVSEQPDVEGDEMEDAGKPENNPKPLVASPKHESPMKVKDKPKKDKPTGPAKSEKPTAKKDKSHRAEPSAANKTVADAFNHSTGSTKGKQGSPNGNSSAGEMTGQPSIGGLVGYTLAYWGRPHSRWTGRIVVRVRVNSRGKVIEAHCTGGSGEAYSHPEVRRNCEQESLKSAFSVPNNRTTEGVGTIVWRFV